MKSVKSDEEVARAIQAEFDKLIEIHGWKKFEAEVRRRIAEYDRKKRDAG